MWSTFATIVAYAYDGAMHCPDCARYRFANAPDLQRPESFPDSQGVPMDARDREGNLVHPVFATDDRNGTDHCDTCGARFDA